MSTKEIENIILRLKIELDKIDKNKANNRLVNSTKRREILNDIANLEKQL